MDPSVPDSGREPAIEVGDAVLSAPTRVELTTVGPDFAVIHHELEVRRYTDLEPDTFYEIEGFAFRTLATPGELLCSFGTVNDVHFGEEIAGLVSGTDIGPTFRSEPGDDPYPDVMNRSAVAEIAAHDFAAVVVKGDLTSHGSVEEYNAFKALYEPAFGDRLHVVRGNHESYHRSDFAATPFQEVSLPGVTLAIIDTSIDGSAAGTVSADQLDQLDETAGRTDQPVLVFGHHPLGDRHSVEKADRTFGIDVDASDHLVDLFARRPVLRGYFAGHTHRNRVRRFPRTGDVPWVEVACVKDYPGAWAEYRVHEHGILQIFRRIAAPDALAWSERTRHMYEGLYEDYAFGTLADRCFVIDTVR